MEAISYQVGIQANLTGSEEVSSGFERMGNAAENMGTKVSHSSASVGTNYRSLALQTAGLTMNTMQLIDVTDRMAKGQMDLGRGSAILAINILQLASNVYMLSKAHWAGVAAGAAQIATMLAQKAHSIALTIVEGARAVAHFIANATASVGLAVPAMIAAIAASTVVGAYLSRPMAQGGIVMSPTVALLGEKGPEAVMPLSSLRGGNTVTININESSSPRVTGDAVIDALRRSGVI